MNKKIAILLSILLIWSLGVWSAPQITTSVNTTRIGLNEVLAVTYKATDLSKVIDQELPIYSDFVQIGISQSSSSNGDYSITVQLRPTRTGKFVIPGIKLYLKNGSSVTANSIAVDVIQGKGNSVRQNNNQQRGLSPQDLFDQMDQQMTLMQLYSELELVKTYLESARLSKYDRDKLKRYKAKLESEIKDIKEHYTNSNSRMKDIDVIPDMNVNEGFFVRAIPSKTSALVGEPITLTYKIFATSAFSNGVIQKLPELKDFVSKDLPIPSNPKAKREVYQGKNYMTLEIKKSIIFPSHAGELIIEPIALSAATENYGTVAVQSPEVTIHVTDLPQKEQQPAFTGALGQFSLGTAINTTKMSTDDVGTFTLTIGGKGNFDIFNAPQIAGLSHHLLLNSPSVMVQTDSINLLLGKKTFTYQFSVDEAGEYEIPAIPFTYYDTDNNQFVTLHSEPIKITVTQGELAKTTAKDKAAQTGKMNSIFKGKFPSNASQPWASSYLYLVSLLLTLLAIPAFVNRKSIQAQVKTQHPLSSHKIAKARLRKAQELLHQGNTAAFYEEISKSIWLYLSEHLGISMSHLNKAELEQKLNQTDIEPSAIRQTIQLITDCEMALYASQDNAGQKEKILEEATTLISFYEQQLKFKHAKV